MEPLDHPVALRMERGLRRSQDSYTLTDSGPDGGGKLSSSVRGEDCRTPNLETHVERNAQTQDSAEIEANGANSGQRFVLLIIVKR